METEKWVKLEGFDDGYEISDMGRVKSYKIFKEGQILIPNYDKDGYEKMTIRHKGKDKTIRISRQVAIHFIPNPHNYPVINHKNGIKDDNRVSNLEWCTVSHNTQHGYDIGLSPKGGDHGQAQCWNVYIDGELVSCYDNSFEIINALSASKSMLYRCCREKELLYGTFEVERVSEINRFNFNKDFQLKETVYEMGTPFKISDKNGNALGYYKSGMELERCTGITNSNAHGLAKKKKAYTDKYYIDKIDKREYIFSPKDLQNIKQHLI